MEQLYIGVDVGKYFSVFFAMTKEGEVVIGQERVATSDEAAWRTLLSRMRERFELHAAFEVGPHYGWMYDLLSEYCREVVVVNVYDFAIITKSHKKTDRIDAQKLAAGLLRGDLPAVHVPDAQTRADRDLVAFVHDLSQRQTSIKCRLRSLLQRHRLECPQFDILSPSGVSWLKTEALPKLDADGARMARMFLAQGQLLRKQRRELRREVQQRIKRYADLPLIQTMPGLGPLTTLAILSSVSDIRRFEEPKALAAYFGVCPIVRQSGQSSRRGGMTKRGNSHVRWLLSVMLYHLHRKDPRARARYQRLKRRRGVGVARGAMMRWIATVLWHMLTKKEPYRIRASEEKKAA